MRLQAPREIHNVYVADDKRYDSMQYRRSGRSGIKLPAISLGLWHNFGGVDNFENSRAMLLRAFDLESPTSISPTITVLPTDRRKKPSARSSKKISSRTATN